MTLDDAVYEIEELMMYRGKCCEEGKLRDILVDLVKSEAQQLEPLRKGSLVKELMPMIEWFSSLEEFDAFVDKLCSRFGTKKREVDIEKLKDVFKKYGGITCLLAMNLEDLAQAIATSDIWK